MRRTGEAKPRALAHPSRVPIRSQGRSLGRQGLERHSANFEGRDHPPSFRARMGASTQARQTQWQNSPELPVVQESAGSSFAGSSAQPYR